jgi:cell wall-associated NlpC family hydrolase
VSDHVGTLGRGGVAIAMSSGLVATMGVPAHAVGRNAAPPEAAPATAPLAVQPVAAFEAGRVAAPIGPQAGSAPLTAPVAAKVSFENSAFTAVPVTTSRQAGGTGASFPAGGFGAAKGSSVLAVAARYLGVPYVYGGTTPIGWDCSGATGYIFRQLGVDLPRTANQQMLASKRISRSEARAGDLVFMVSGGAAYHVGIYAGNNVMYDAQRTGKRFTKREIYTSSVVFGRVL